MFKESNGAGDYAIAALGTSGNTREMIGIEGTYHVECHDKDGNLKWVEEFTNQVVEAGKKLMLDTLLFTASGYTRVGPYLGLTNVTGGTVASTALVAGVTYQILVVGTSNFLSAGAVSNTVGTVFVATASTSGTGSATVIGTFSPTDTMSSHAGWTEFTSYTYLGTGVRATYAFNAATLGGQTLPQTNVTTSTGTAVTYAINGSGTVGGCFLVTGSGAVNTFSSTAGTLYSAGAFSTPKAVSSGDTLAVTYTTTATS